MTDMDRSYVGIKIQMMEATVNNSVHGTCEHFDCL